MAGPENSRSSRKEKIRSRFRTVMHYAACHIKSNLAQAAHLPFFKGLLFRDHFGKQLKKVACLYKKGQCHSCRATALCDYARYFEMPGSLPDSLRPAMASPPRPFVIEPPETQETRLPGGSPFDFNLLLFGGALRAAPTFIRALEAMGEAGIGPDNVPFEIKSVVCGKQTIYQAGKTVRPGIPDAEEISMPDMEESSGGQLTLSLALRTPLRVKQNCLPHPVLSFQTLTRMMLRRVSVLLDCYGEGAPDLDYKLLIRKANGVETVSAELAWFDWKRHAFRRDKSLLKGGINGSAVFSGDIGPYLPLIQLCQKLHIGRQTLFGLGRYESEILA